MGWWWPVHDITKSVAALIMAWQIMRRSILRLVWFFSAASELQEPEPFSRRRNLAILTAAVADAAAVSFGFARILAQVPSPLAYCGLLTWLAAKAHLFQKRRLL